MNRVNKSKDVEKCNREWLEAYSTKKFEKEYTYEGNDLGAVYSKENTVFKLWSPYAESVLLNLYKSGDAREADLADSVPMEKGEKGVWSVKVNGDLDGVHYTYSVAFNEKYQGIYDCEVCDPYAKACGVNGKRAMVVDLSSTDPEGFDKDTNPNEKLPLCDSVIYELHVRDLSADDSAGIKNRGKFLGLAEEGTTVDGEGKIYTGLSHILELGVTHIHLLPFYDYATIDETEPFSEEIYNWGYDPLNYNVPEGTYATDALHGKVRITELKKTIQKLHQKGISVIMDVVYNHTYNDDFCFNKVVPCYFHRTDMQGVKSNGSACGNDTASERSMVSKYIVDSVLYWAREYHLDGFRFDLVGLLDVDTINHIREGLDQIRPNIMMYGEGWILDTNVTKENILLATQTNVKYLKRFAMFSDDIRDAIKGHVFYEEEKGFISGETEVVEELKAAMMGLPDWSDSPEQVINYTSCHDNYTLFDKIYLCNEGITFMEAVKQNLLAIAIVMLSQGTPLLHAGEEILRTKVNSSGEYVSDSVRAPDSVNAIKWSNLKKEEYYHVYEYYQGLIAFRKKHSLLRLDSGEKVRKHMRWLETQEKTVVAYELQNTEEKLLAVFNGGEKPYTFELPDGEQFDVFIDDKQAGDTSLAEVSVEVIVPSVSCMVLVKK